MYIVEDAAAAAAAVALHDTKLNRAGYIKMIKIQILARTRALHTQHTLRTQTNSDGISSKVIFNIYLFIYFYLSSSFFSSCLDAQEETGRVNWHWQQSP